jgi:hypothetical protein
MREVKRGVKLAIDKGDTLSVIIGIGLFIFAFGIPFCVYNWFGGITTVLVGAMIAVIGIALQSEE